MLVDHSHEIIHIMEETFTHPETLYGGYLTVPLYLLRSVYAACHVMQANFLAGACHNIPVHGPQL